MGWPALWAGKIVIVLLRLAGRGGSTLPGRVSGRLDPGLLGRLALATRRGNAVVTGTNGKTTTATMLATILAAAGLRVTHNRSGANLLSGITTAYIAAAGWNGRGRDFGLVEVDEATMPHATRALGPRLALVTNFFRDQLDRYGELMTAVRLVRRGLAAMPPGAVAVLNADDPLVASLADAVGERLHLVFFGIDAPDAAGRGTAAPAEGGRCPRCGGTLRYTSVHYAHLGHYACTACSWGRPAPDVVLTALTGRGARGSVLRLRLPEGELEVRLGLGGIYNVYNALAAAAAAQALGVRGEVVRRALESFSSSFGRMESIRMDGKEAFLALVKNPVGFSEVLRAVLDEPQPGKVILCAINDRYADGRDVSWLWDADIEQLGRRGDGLEAVIASGTRAEDMALRLKYAGVPQGRLVIERELGAALRAGLERVPQGGTLYILPTYTAMLEARELITRQGYAQHFWEV